MAQFKGMRFFRVYLLRKDAPIFPSGPLSSTFLELSCSAVSVQALRSRLRRSYPDWDVDNAVIKETNINLDASEFLKLVKGESTDLKLSDHELGFLIDCLLQCGFLKDV